MAKIEQSLPKDNYKSPKNTDFTNNLKQILNVNVKHSRSFKWDIFHKLITLLILLVILSFLLIIIVSIRIFLNETTQNAEQIFKMYEKYEKYDRRIKDLEVQMNNVMLRFKHNEQNSNIQHIQSMDYSESKSESSTSYSVDLSETENDRDYFNTTSELDDLTTPSAFDQNSNSIQHIQSMNCSESNSKSSTSNSADLSETKTDNSNIILELDDLTTLSASVQSLDHQNNEFKSNISQTLDVYPTSPIRLNKNNFIQSTIDKLSRQKRTLNKMQNRMTEDGGNHNDAANIRTKSQIKERRNRRRGGKGKKRQKKREEGQGRGRPERNRRRLGPKVVTFIGAIPEQAFRDTVNVGPWIKSDRNNTIVPSSYHFTKFYLREEDHSIEINMNGLYMISVQIFYFGKSVNHSYWVLLNQEGSSRKRKLITCATGYASEITCYTGVTTYLQTGDRLTIQQQEKNRFSIICSTFILYVYLYKECSLIRKTNMPTLLPRNQTD